MWPLITPHIEVKLPAKLWQTFSENTSKLYNRANHIISYPGTSYASFCEVYYKSTRVCDDCKLLGKVSYLPSLCFCDTCRAVFVEFRGQFAVTAKVATKTPLRRTFLLVLPDCPHVGKSMKAAFSNWWLKYNGERINLALIRTLRNRSNKETKATLRKLTPKNDHVKNKDRQDPSSVLTLCNTKLTTELKDVGYVCHTIISELDRYSPDTQLGMFPKPISIAIPSSGWIAFLSYDVKSSLSTLYKARLHSAVKKISAIR